MLDPLVTAYVEKLNRSGVPADHVHKTSGIPASTVWRWLNEGASPNLATLRKLDATLDALIAEKANAS